MADKSQAGSTGIDPCVASASRGWGSGFLELIGLIGPDLPRSDDPKRTARVIRLMLTTVILLLLVMSLWVLTNDATMMTIVWGLFVAGCALLAGAALGVLFGLPSKRIVEVRATGTAASVAADPDAKPGMGDDAANQDTGYVESTNLERVADWLTTMIIGLTLTQYGAWEARYFDLSRSVTAAMEIRLDVCAASPGPVTNVGAGERIVTRNAASGPVGDAGPVAKTGPGKLTRAERDCINAQAIPGGMLMAIFAIIGFIVSYLWMRRYFIFEMVTAREEERQRYRRKLEKERINDDPLAAAIAQIATANAERDAAVAVAEAAKAKAASDVEAARVAQMSAVAKVNADAAAEAARVTAQLQTSHQIVETSPARPPATSEALQEIAEKALAVAPQVEVVSSRIHGIIAEIGNKAITYPDDPWRGRLSGEIAAGGYSMSATVQTNALDANLFDLKIIVHADDAAASLGKSVWFLLHPTFGTEPRVAAFDGNGDAVLSLITYGAFTVGAILEDGTVLELNLAEIDAPAAFRQR